MHRHILGMMVLVLTFCLALSPSALKAAGDNTDHPTAPVTAPVTTASDLYEAENGTLGSISDHLPVIYTDDNASGGKGVDTMWPAGNSVTFSNVDGGLGGGGAITLSYANGSTATDTAILLVNGTTVGKFSLPPTGGYNRYQTTAPLVMPLKAGTTNTIKIQSSESCTDVFNFDCIHVAKPAPPTVALTSPNNGATFTSPATITITANATACNGTISTVKFYQGATLLAVVTSTPYNYSWTGMAAGSYTLSAVALDSHNQTTSSTTIGVTVKAPGEPAVSTNSAVTVSAVYEAESGSVRSPTGHTPKVYSDANASGGKAVCNMWAAGNYILFTNVDGDLGGNSTLTLTYSNGNAATAGAYVIVNSGKPVSVRFPPTGSYSTYQTTSPLNITLNAGTTNTIQVASDRSGNDMYNLDKITVNRPQPSATSYQAEDGELHSTVGNPPTIYSDAVCSGGKGVNTLWPEGNAVIFHNVAGGATGGNRTVSVTYSNGGTSTLTAYFVVNGGTPIKISLPPTGGWLTYATITPVPIALQAGNTNTIWLQSDQSGACTYNADKITVTIP